MEKERGIEFNGWEQLSVELWGQHQEQSRAAAAPSGHDEDDNKMRRDNIF